MRYSKILRTVVLLFVVGVLVYTYRAPLVDRASRLTHVYFPCERPITYTVVALDERFGLSDAELSSAILEAEALWEVPIDKELFLAAEGGSVKVSLIYDHRQEATKTLRSLGLAIDDTRTSYDGLKAKYDTLHADYEKKRLLYTALVDTFTQKQDAYNSEVARSNARGGAKRAEYDRLVAERESFEGDIAKIHLAEAELNTIIEELNALVVVLNRQASALNLNVERYNEVGETRGQEFDEGVYRSGPSGESIDIFQFDNREKLVQVLAHELGHALGLPHLDDPESIMYRLNEGGKKKLSPDDLDALKTLCGITEKQKPPV